MFSYKVADALFLVRQAVSTEKSKPAVVEVPTNHIMVIDCSGSMSYELPKIREQLKKKLPKLLKAEDTISIIWFSGRRECGILLEAEPVASLTDLKAVETAIDRWLKPVGLTGFKDPLDLIPGLTAKISKTRPNSVFSIFFMSDGCDNCSSRPEIIKAVEVAGQSVASATFVEYGYYADRQLLAQMAEKAGGSTIFAQHFDQFEPALEASLQKRTSGAPKVEVKITGDSICGFAFGFSGNDLLTFAVEGGAIHAPKDLPEVWYLSSNSVGTQELDLVKFSEAATGSTKTAPASYSSVMAATYAAISLFSNRMKSDVVLSLLKSMGDVTFIDAFSTCFGKQKYSEFVEASQKAAFDPSVRFTNGRDLNRIPKDDAFTVLDLLRVLSSDESNRLLLDSKDFKYNRIGRGQIDSSSLLTDEEQAEVARLTAEMTKTKDGKKVADFAAKIATITSSKDAPLKFEATPLPDGCEISGLVYNEERPNVSVKVFRKGLVDLTERRAKATNAGNGDLGKIPAVIDTNIWRNYTIIKDGLVNVEQLPVRLTAGTIRTLKDKGMPIETILGVGGEAPETARIRAAKASDDRDVNVVFDLKALPIINRQMIKEASAQVLFEKEYALCKARAAQKVFSGFLKEKFPKVSAGLSESFGEPATLWLKELGITDGGFNPKSVQAESTDVYMGKELKTSLKGLSTIPSVNEAKKKIAAGGKLTPSVALMAPYLKEVDDYLASPEHKANEAGLEQWAKDKAETATKTVRGLLFDLANTKFSILVGQIWFTEFKSLDEDTLTITVDGQQIEGKVQMREVEVKI